MRRKLSAVAQGTPDMLTLKTLALETMHGYGIGLRVEHISKGYSRYMPARSFPDSGRLERQGGSNGSGATPRITDVPNNYLLTEQGRKELKTETRDRQTQIAAMARIPEATSGER